MPRGELLHHAQVRALVGIAGEQPIDLQVAALLIHAFGIEELRQVGLRLVDLARRYEERRDDAQCRGRLRLDFVPGLRRVEREVVQPALVRHLHRAARDARVARTSGEVEVGLRGERVIASLLRDLAEQHVVELGVVIRGGLSERGGMQAERDNGKGEKQATKHGDPTDLRYIWCCAQAASHG